LLEFNVTWKKCPYRVRQYQQVDEHEIVDNFFFWKITALMAKTRGHKTPQLPQTFSEPFCCYTCNLAHNLGGSGPDAFLVRKEATNKVQSAIEIKATITPQGFTDVKRDLDFDELYWLSMAGYENLTYEIYSMPRSMIEGYVKRSKTVRDRGTVNLTEIVHEGNLKPFRQGYIGIVTGNA